MTKGRGRNVGEEFADAPVGRGRWPRRHDRAIARPAGAGSFQGQVIAWGDLGEREPQMDADGRGFFWISAYSEIP